MYHPGKVLKVFSPADPDVVSSDRLSQAMVSMWDENLTTVSVHKNLSGQIKVDDIVLIDYRPLSTNLPVPKLVVTKILKGEAASLTWKTYREKFRALKGKPLPFMSSPGASIQPSHSYIG
jgi:hypothetical protein